MGVAIAHYCGRGRGGSGQIVTLHCDHPSCHASCASSSREEYEHQHALGWRVGPKMPGGGQLAVCPEHSEAEPTVPVQQELVL